MNITIYNMIPWVAFNDLVKMHLDIKFRYIDDFFIDGIEWNPLEEWREVDDLKIHQCLERLKPFSGELVVVTDASYMKGLSPFRINAEDIKQFVENHYENFNQRFMETDVIIINFDTKTAWLFHHEGVYGVASYDTEGANNALIAKFLEIISGFAKNSQEDI